MDEEEAIARVREYARGEYPNYPADDLRAVRFEIGWWVSRRTDPDDFRSLRPGEPVFMIGDSGDIMGASSSRPPGERKAEFMRRYGNAS